MTLTYEQKKAQMEAGLRTVTLRYEKLQDLNAIPCDLCRVADALCINGTPALNFCNGCDSNKWYHKYLSALNRIHDLLEKREEHYINGLDKLNEEYKKER